METRTGQLSGGLRASAAYLTGSLAGVNAAIPGYPVFAAQALPYTLATTVLAVACWIQGRRHPLEHQRIRLTRRIAVLLALQATVGVTGFNYCTAEAGRGDDRAGRRGRGGPGRGGRGRRSGRPGNEKTENQATGKGRYGGGAAAQPDADGGTACLAHIARTGAPRGAAPPHSVTIQACPYMYKS